MFKLEEIIIFIFFIISGLIKKAVKGDFAEDEKLKVNTSGDSSISNNIYFLLECA
jgi:hypothetical protein